MKNLVLAAIAAMVGVVSSSAAAADASGAVYEADCGMQTYPASPNEAPHTFALAHVKVASGQSITIYKSGKLDYVADFLADSGGLNGPLFMITVSLIDTTHGRKVTQANVSSHDLKALEALMVGLYPPGPLPTAACGTQM